jgi:benzylsuccinate CoA-transferase BbsF subunit
MGEHGVYAGLRVLELGGGLVGALATRFFAEQGATVIRVESAARPDPLRTLGSTPGDAVDPDASVPFALANPDKWSARLDLAKPAAVALALRLADWADVVVVRSASDALAAHGLGAAELLARKPSLLVVTAGPDDGGTDGPALAARCAALLIAAALHERAETGRGRHLDVSRELADRFTPAAAPADVAAHRGVYSCAGDTAEIAISLPDGDARAKLMAVLGDAVPDAAGAALDRSISEWTRRRGAYDAFAMLQAAGVACGVVQDDAALLRDPQLAHRRHFVVLDHAVLGPLPYPRAGFRLSTSPGGFDDSGPLLGEDDDLVFGDLLGLAPEEIERLMADGVIA